MIAAERIKLDKEAFVVVWLSYTRLSPVGSKLPELVKSSDFRRYVRNFGISAEFGVADHILDLEEPRA